VQTRVPVADPCQHGRVPDLLFPMYLIITFTFGPVALLVCVVQVLLRWRRLREPRSLAWLSGLAFSAGIALYPWGMYLNSVGLFPDEDCRAWTGVRGFPEIGVFPISVRCPGPGGWVETVPVWLNPLVVLLPVLGVIAAWRARAEARRRSSRPASTGTSAGQLRQATAARSGARENRYAASAAGKNISTP
jgi:hypothetical protein